MYRRTAGRVVVRGAARAACAEHTAGAPLPGRGGMPRCLEVFPLATVAEATKNWDKGGTLGRGGYGTVFAGTLPDGRKIAVKRLRLGDGSQKSSHQVCVGFTPRAPAAAATKPVARVQHLRDPRAQGDAEFLTEAAYSVLIQHANLLPVLGIGARRSAPRRWRRHVAPLPAQCAPRRRVPTPLTRATRAPQRWTTMSAVWCTRS